MWEYLRSQVPASQLDAEELVLEDDKSESESSEKLGLHPKRQGNLEEAPTLASVTHTMVQVFRIARPMEGVRVRTAWTVSRRFILKRSSIV